MTFADAMREPLPRCIALLFVAGCLTKPSPPAPSDAALASLCETGSPQLFEGFEMSSSPDGVCGGVSGSVCPQDTLVRSDGDLVWEAGKSASCTWSSIAAASAVIVKWSEISADKSDVQTDVAIDDDGGTETTHLQLVYGRQMQLLDNHGTTDQAWQGSLWWRIRASSQTIVGEVSPDGTTWSTVGTNDVGQTADIHALIIDHTTDPTDAMAVSLDSIYVCR